MQRTHVDTAHLCTLHASGGTEELVAIIES